MSRAALRARSDYAWWLPLSTRWHDNDVYGHVNNAVYYGWFDTAVNTWLLQAGLLDYDKGDPIGLVVETGCRYASSLAFPQDVEIGLLVANLGRSSVTYHLGAFEKGRDDAAAEAHFTHVYVGRDNRRPVSLPDTWRQALMTLMQTS